MEEEVTYCSKKEIGQMRKTIQRIKALYRRLKKSKRDMVWLARWDNASKRCWAILSNGTPSIKRFERFERNHNRLLRLTDNKWDG